MTGTGVVIPVRAFALGKARLAAQLDDANRADLARKLADRVGAAAGELPTVVVSSASDVRDWARSRGLEVVDDPGTLDDAAATGRGWVGARGCARAVIAHADLPLARSLAPLGRDGTPPRPGASASASESSVTPSSPSTSTSPATSTGSISLSPELPTPERALAIGAHSDDVDFGCGATLAKWADDGAEVRLLVLTDGSKGTWDPDADLGELVA